MIQKDPALEKSNAGLLKERFDMFRKANPVWEKDKSAEKNYELYFRCQLGKQTDVTLRIATSCEYQLWINGIFIAFGPAKAAHGFFKVDTVLLDGYLHEQINTVVLKTVSANINSFAVLDQPPFVTAEIDTEPYNEVSLGFHQAMGFREVGVQTVRNNSIRVSLQEAKVKND